MSVDYRAVWAYGYLVDAEEDIIDNACAEHGTVYCHVGNNYSDEIKYIISAKGLCEYTDDFCEVRDSAMPEEVDAIRQTLKQITGKPPQTEPRSYLGLYVF